MKLFLSLLFTFLVCAPSIALPQSFQANNTGNQAGQAPAKLALTWPLPGVENEVWVVNNYFDLDPGPGLLDYRGGSRTLNNHFAVDIDVPNFRWMDNDFPVLAAAGGVVIEVEDSFFDRNLSCTGNGNYVTLKHTNGNTTDYGHLKQSSALVSVGQKVQQGDEIAVVGSSGCSTQPHLHFSLHDSNGTAIDPFNEGYWINPPRYNTPVSFMDAVINDGQITSVDEIKDPTPNLTSIDAGSVLGVGLSMANGHNGDSIEIRLINHGRLAENEVSIPLWTGARHTFWYFNFQLPYRYWGDWNVEILTNGNVVAEYPIEVLPPPGFAQEEHFMVPASNFQSLLDSQQTRGYRPIWIDTFQLQGITYFNTIFEGGSSFAFDTLFHLNGAAYQNDFNTYTSQGYRLTHVVSYLLSGIAHYAATFEQSPGTGWVTYHGASESSHTASYNAWVSLGFRPVCISAVEENGSTYVTALYDARNVGDLWGDHKLTEAQFQSIHDQQTALGRTLAAVRGYEAGGVTYLAAVWDSYSPVLWAAGLGMSSPGFQSQHNHWENLGYLLRVAAAYISNGQITWSAHWSE